MSGVGTPEEMFTGVVRAFEDKIPFNKLLGLRIDEVALDRVQMSFDKRPEHVGNWSRNLLHGGVISAVLDTTGGLVAFLHAAERMQGEPPEVQAEVLGRIGTIDLRVDYLRAAVGDRFFATGHILRAGSRVAVSRMELHDADRAAANEESLVAVGTGTYIIG